MSTHKVEEKVTQYASGDVTKEVKVDGHHVSKEHVAPATTQHVEVKHDGKVVADHHHAHVGDANPGVHAVGTTLPATYVDKHGGAHPVVEAYQEGTTPHGHAYHERVDVVHPDHKDKIKIKGDNEKNIPVLDQHGHHVTAVHELEHGKAPHPHHHGAKDHHGTGIDVHDNPRAHHGATNVVDPRVAHLAGASYVPGTTVDPHHVHGTTVDPHHVHGTTVDPHHVHGTTVDPHHVHGTTVDPHHVHGTTVDPHHVHGTHTTVDPHHVHGTTPIVDTHGKHHVVGPTGGIVSTHGRETSNIVDMAKQVATGQLPPNEQVKAELQPLQHHLLEKEKTASNPETEEAMRNARKLVEAVENTIDTKNSGDKFQRLIDAASRVAARASGTPNSTALAKETREFVELLKDLVIELGRSKAFRKALLDLFTLLKDIVSEEVNVEGHAVAHHAFVEGETREVATHLKDKTATAMKDLPEHQKRTISAQLKHLLIELRDHHESALAIQKTLRLATLLNKELSTQVSRAQGDPDVIEVTDLAIAIIQSFALGVDVRTYLLHLQRAIEFVQNEVVIQEYLYECADFLNRTIDHPERIDSDLYIQEAEALTTKGRKLAKLAKEHPIIGQVMDEASALVYAMKTDEQLNDIKYRAGKVAESLTYTDAEGKSHINFDVVSVMRSELVPFFIDRIREVQVPGFRIENEGKFQYLEVHDLYVTLGDVLPDRIRIKTTNDTDLTMENLSAPVTSASYIKFFMEGLRPEFKDFFFSFKRTGKVIKLKDEGRADLRIKGKGVNIYMTFALEMDSEHRAMLGKHKVELDMGPIDLDITQAEHKKMLNLASSMFAPKIKTAIEQSLKAKIEEIGGEWASILNKRVLSTIPSISTIGTKVKQTLTPNTTTHHEQSLPTATGTTHHEQSLPTANVSGTTGQATHTHVHN